MKQEEFYLNQLDRECIKIPGKDGKYLLRNNFLNEYYTDKDKAKVLSNLGITPLLERLEALVKAKLVDNAGNLRFGLKPTSYREDPNALTEVLSSDTIYNSLLLYYTKEEIDEWRERVFDTINLLRDLVNSVDDELADSTNPVQNKVLYRKFNLIENELRDHYIRDYYLNLNYYDRTQVLLMLGLLRSYVDQKLEECCGGEGGGGSVVSSDKIVVTINLENSANVILCHLRDNLSTIEVDGVQLSINDDFFITTNLDSGQHIIEYTLTDPTHITEYMFRNAFTNCDSVNITIPPLITSIDAGAFLGCKFTSMTVDADNTIYDSRDNCNAIIETSINMLTAGSINSTIPNTVTTIGVLAFSSQNGITEITIPSSVVTIGTVAFDSTPLTSITIPSSVVIINTGAFKCNTLTSITFEGTNPPLCGMNIFKGTNCPIYVPCNSVNEYKIAENLEDYADRILCQESLEESNIIVATFNITNTNGAVRIMNEYYENYFNKVWIDDIEQQEITSSYTFSTTGEHIVKYELKNQTIPSMAFAECLRLKSIVIPNTITSIGSNAFAGSGLTSVTIGYGVTYIGQSAFNNYMISTLTISCVTPPELDGDIIGPVDSLSSIRVPAGSVNTYKSDVGWSRYSPYITGYN